MARYISKAKRGPKKSKVIIFLNVVIGLLAAFCIFMLIGFFTTDNDHYYDRGFDAYYISYTIDKGDYAQLLGDYYRDYGILGMVESGSEERERVDLPGEDDMPESGGADAFPEARDRGDRDAGGPVGEGERRAGGRSLEAERPEPFHARGSRSP